MLLKLTVSVNNSLKWIFLKRGETHDSRYQETGVQKHIGEYSHVIVLQGRRVAIEQSKHISSQKLERQTSHVFLVERHVKVIFKTKSP